MESQITSLQQFALDAKKWGYPAYLIPETFDRKLYADEKMLLDFRAWKAVAKAQGLEDMHFAGCDSLNDYCSHPDEECECEKCDCPARFEYKNLARRFYDRILDGEDIDEALED